MLDHHGHFVTVSRVIGLTAGNGLGQDVAVAVLVLQAFTVQRCSPGGATHQETAGLNVTRRPGQIAHTLKTKHGVENVERYQREVVGAVGGCRCHPGRHGTIFVDPFLKHLTFLVFLVVHDLVTVFRHVLLAFRGVDTHLAEHALHPEGTGLVRYDRNNSLTDALVFGQSRQQSHERHGGGDLTTVGAFQQVLEGIQWRRLQWLTVLTALGIETAQFLPALVHVNDFRAVRRRPVIGHVLELFVLQRHRKAVTEGFQLLDIEFLERVRRVLRFAGVTKAITLDGMSQNHRRPPTVVMDGVMIGRIDLVRIVATAIKLVDVLVGEVFHHLGQLRVFAEEVLTGIGRAVALEVLQVAVNGFVHDALHQAVLILLEQRIPHAAPDHFQYVPASSPEYAFQFLDNLAVTTHRAVEALQVTVNDKDQVAQVFAASHRDGTQGFGLVALAIPDKAPDLAVAHVDQLTTVQILHHVSLIDGLDRPKAHGHRWELPVIRHQPGVGVGRQAFTVHLFPVFVQLIFVKTPFQVGAGVNTW